MVTAADDLSASCEKRAIWVPRRRSAVSFTTDNVSKFELSCQRLVNLAGKFVGDSTKSPGKPSNYPCFLERSVSAIICRSSRARPGAAGSEER